MLIGLRCSCLCRGRAEGGVEDVLIGTKEGGESEEIELKSERKKGRGNTGRMFM